MIKDNNEYHISRGPIKNIIKSHKTNKLVPCLYGCARYLILDREKGILVCPNCGRSPANSQELVPLDANKLLTADGFTSTGQHTSPRAQKFRSKFKSRTLTPKPKIDSEMQKLVDEGAKIISYSERIGGNETVRI
jgi:hypothetical protein